MRFGIWLPFASFLVSFNRFKPSTVKLASGCKLPVAISQECANWHLAAVCRFPNYRSLSDVLRNRTGIWLPIASCQFIRVSELTCGCRLPVSYLALLVLNPLKSNWLLAASCQLPIHKTLRMGIWLPVARCSFTRICNLASG